jgi:hypothetical protein
MQKTVKDLPFTAKSQDFWARGLLPGECGFEIVFPHIAFTH